MLLKNETKLGGLSLALGALTILITIFFEYQIQWIGVERPAEEIPGFIFQNWYSFKLIWGWQALGQALLALGYLLLFKNAQGYKALLWGSLFICGLIVVVAFLMTLGGYFPALEVYDESPAIFLAVRGAVRAMYSTLMISLALLVVAFFLELFGKEGVIERILGFANIGLIVLALGIGFLVGLSPKVTGATVFLVPLVLGYAHVKNA